MAFSLNKAQLIGNVTRDPEVRVAGGQKVATFGLATNFSWKDAATGQRKDKAEFHNIVAWRRLAEICEQYVRRGSKIYVEGRIQTREWEGEDGVKRYKTEITMDNMIMLDKKGDFASVPVSSSEPVGEAVADQPREQRSVKPKETTEAVAPQAVEEEVAMDDLPF